MPHIHVWVSDGTLRAVRMACAREGKTQKAWVIEKLMEASDGPREVSGVEPSQEVLGMRSGVRVGRKGKRTGKVLRPQHTTQPDTRAVGERIRDNPTKQGANEREGKELSVMDRPYRGPEHAKNCGGTVCVLKRGG